MGKAQARKKPAPVFKRRKTAAAPVRTPQGYGPADRQAMYDEYVELAEYLGRKVLPRRDLPHHELIDALTIYRVAAKRKDTGKRAGMIVTDQGVSYYSRRKSVRATEAKPTRETLARAEQAKRKRMLDG